MNQFIRGIREGFLLGVEVWVAVSPVICSAVVCALFPTVIIGHFTGHIGLAFMDKQEAISSLRFLMVTHTLLTAALLLPACTCLYILYKNERKTKK
jgi:hypothetical protein